MLGPVSVDDAGLLLFSGLYRTGTSRDLAATSIDYADASPMPTVDFFHPDGIRASDTEYEALTAKASSCTECGVWRIACTSHPQKPEDA